MAWGSGTILVISAFLWLNSSLASACSCEPPPPISGIDGVTFVGRVTESTLQSDDDYRQMVRMHLHVLRSWTGVVDDEVDIGSASSGASCGAPLDVGSEYLVFANPNSSDAKRWGFPTINLCDRTRSLSGAEHEIQQLDSLLSMAEGELVGAWEYLPLGESGSKVQLVFGAPQGEPPSGVFQTSRGDESIVVGEWRVSVVDGKRGVVTISVTSPRSRALTQPLLEPNDSGRYTEFIKCAVTGSGLKLVDQDQREVLYERSQTTVVEDDGWGHVKKTLGR